MRPKTLRVKVFVRNYGLRTSVIPYVRNYGCDRNYGRGARNATKEEVRERKRTDVQTVRENLKLAVETFQARVSCRISTTFRPAEVVSSVDHSFLYANGYYGPDFHWPETHRSSKGASGMTLLDTLNEKNRAR